MSSLGSINHCMPSSKYAAPYSSYSCFRQDAFDTDGTTNIMGVISLCSRCPNDDITCRVISCGPRSYGILARGGNKSQGLYISVDWTDIDG